jgi:hypothetical protein
MSHRRRGVGVNRTGASKYVQQYRNKFAVFELDVVLCAIVTVCILTR